jgi:aspartyl-tRNA(Asn)/glutamyl-tRNA(Gln) amidotransferase subunit A
VRDAALFLDAVAGVHPSDPDSLPHPGISYVEVLEGLPKRLRIAWSPTLGFARVQKDVMREVREAVRVFEKLGHSVEELEEAMPDPGLAWVMVAGGEVYAEIVDLIEDHRSEFGRGFLAGAERGRELTPDRYGAAQRVRAELVNFLWRLFDRYDLLLTPTLPTEAFDARGKMPPEIDGRPVENPLHFLPFTYPFNLSGHPAATVRAGLTDAGLPAGLQIVGPRHRDDLVLQASYAYEQERPWNHDWPREIRALEGE